MSNKHIHSREKPVTTMLTYPWKCTVLHCNHLRNTWKPLVLMTQHFGYCPSTSEGDNQSVRSSAPVVSRCFPGGYNVKLYISRGRLAWWLLTFLHSGLTPTKFSTKDCTNIRDVVFYLITYMQQNATNAILGVTSNFSNTISSKCPQTIYNSLVASTMRQSHPSHPCQLQMRY